MLNAIRRFLKSKFRVSLNGSQSIDLCGLPIERIMIYMIELLRDYFSMYRHITMGNITSGETNIMGPKKHQGCLTEFGLTLMPIGPLEYVSFDWFLMISPVNQIILRGKHSINISLLSFLFEV